MATKLNINPSVTYSGVLDFDASSYIQLSSLPNVDQDIRVTFKMYLTKESGYSSSTAGNVILTFYDNVNNARFVVGLKSSDFYVTVSGFGAGNWLSSLSGHSNKIIEVEIIKSAGGSDWEVNSVTFNGASQTDTGTNTFGTGGDVYTIGSFGSGSELDDAYIWDINVYNSGDTLIHSWAGHPSGNLDSSWEDQTASIDGTVSGNSPFFTSDITGTGGGSVSSMSKKLELDPSSNKGVLLLSGTYVEQPFFTFITGASTASFTPTILASGSLEWDLGDGSTWSGSYVNHTYTQVGDKTVKVYAGTTGGKDAVYSIVMDNDEIKGGTFDFSDYPILQVINLSSNPNVTEIIMQSDSSIDFYQFQASSTDISYVDLSGYTNLRGTIDAFLTNITSLDLIPDSSRAITSFRFNNCNLTGTVDVSGLTNLGGYINFGTNPNLTHIINPINSSTNVTNYYAYGCNLTGTLDMSGFLEFGGSFRCDSNPLLTELIIPVSGNNVNQFYVMNCGLTGTLDISGLSNLGGTFRCDGNELLTQVIFPTSSRTFSQFIMYTCDLTGTLDISGLSGLGGTVSLYNNPKITGILLPVSSTAITSFSLSQCDQLPVIDISSLTNLSGTVQFTDCPSLNTVLTPSTSGTISSFHFTRSDIKPSLDLSGLTITTSMDGGENVELQSISWPTISTEWQYVRMDDCSLNQTTVDNLFSIMNTYYSSNAPTSSLELTINGGTNSPPTDGSSNANILNLVDIFAAEVQVLTININYP